MKYLNSKTNDKKPQTKASIILKVLNALHVAVGIFLCWCVL